MVALVLSSHAQEPEVTQLAQWALDNLALCTSDEVCGLRSHAADGLGLLLCLIRGCGTAGAGGKLPSARH